LSVCGAYCAVVVTWSTDDAGTAAAVVVAATLTLSLGLLPNRRATLALLTGSGALFAVIGHDAADAVEGLAIAAVCLTTGRATMWIFAIVSDLDTARQAQAKLAVAEERLRFSRDVHDVLGRRLSAIGVQAELAATLSDRGDERAAGRMREVRAVAHESLREAREMARGYRATDFLNELDGARSLLHSAGIAFEQDVDTMPRAWHEAAGWIVRESVTNVLRHSSAEKVDIAYTHGRLSVVNDHAHPGGASDGAGLRGLRERLALLGASLDAELDGDERWTVVAHLPATGPLSAAVRSGHRT
jgi:two-component system sensor histidine kinase DesK